MKSSKTVPATGPDGFHNFYSSVYSDKRWKKLYNALLQSTHLVAVSNPNVPPRWVAKELHRTKAQPCTAFPDKFSKGIGIFELPDHYIGESSDNNDTKGDLSSTRDVEDKSSLSRWPVRLPMVGRQPGDLALDFEGMFPSATRHVDHLNPAKITNYSLSGPNSYGGLKDKIGWYLMDLASIAAPLLLNPQPGEKVLDLCAAPGGKSLILAYLLFTRPYLYTSTCETNNIINEWNKADEEVKQIALANQGLHATKAPFTTEEDEPCRSSDDIYNKYKEQLEQQDMKQFISMLPRSSSPSSSTTTSSTTAVSTTSSTTTSSTTTSSTTTSSTTTSTTTTSVPVPSRQQLLLSSSTYPLMSYTYKHYSKRHVLHYKHKLPWLFTDTLDNADTIDISHPVIQSLMTHTTANIVVDNTIAPNTLNNNINNTNTLHNNITTTTPNNNNNNNNMSLEMSIEQDLQRDYKIRKNHQLLLNPRLIKDNLRPDWESLQYSDDDDDDDSNTSKYDDSNDNISDTLAYNNDIIQQQPQQQQQQQDKCYNKDENNNNNNVQHTTIPLPMITPTTLPDNNINNKLLLAYTKLAPQSRLVLNDVSTVRVKRLQKVIQQYMPMQYIPQIDITNIDASVAHQFTTVTRTATGQVSVKKNKNNINNNNNNNNTSSSSSSIQNEGEFDCILVDAPCSSDRHIIHDNALANWTIDHTKDQSKRQILLLSAALRSLKYGGRCVYSTCSLSPYENDHVVSSVLKLLNKDIINNNNIIKENKKNNNKNDTKQTTTNTNNTIPPVKGQYINVSFKLHIGEPTQYGWIILPDQPQCTWGPLYISYIKRVE